ncbi:MAG: hypothetical protein RhofKO_31220 [Rhodothermales bacterium]
MATAQETSIGEQLKALVRLQHIDSRIDQIKKLRGDLPDEIRDLEDEVAGLNTRISNFNDEVKENELAKRQGELDIKDADMLVSRYEDQQLQVRNNREYDALTKEIEAQKQRKIDAEMKLQSIAANAPMVHAQIEETTGRKNDLQAVLDEKKKELDEVLNDTKQEQERIEAQRDAAAEAVDQRYLHAYTRLRGRVRDGRAVVPLERGAAAGFAVPPQRQVEIRQRNRIIACEHTGRIIVDEDLFAETRETLDL